MGHDRIHGPRGRRGPALHPRGRNGYRSLQRPRHRRRRHAPGGAASTASRTRWTTACGCDPRGAGARTSCVTSRRARTLDAFFEPRWAERAMPEFARATLAVHRSTGPRCTNGRRAAGGDRRGQRSRGASRRGSWQPLDAAQPECLDRLHLQGVRALTAYLAAPPAPNEQLRPCHAAGGRDGRVATQPRRGGRQRRPAQCRGLRVPRVRSGGRVSRRASAWRRLSA